MPVIQSKPPLIHSLREQSPPENLTDHIPAEVRSNLVEGDIAGLYTETFGALSLLQLEHLSQQDALLGGARLDLVPKLHEARAAGQYGLEYPELVLDGVRRQEVRSAALRPCTSKTLLYRQWRVAMAWSNGYGMAFAFSHVHFVCTALS